MSKPSTFKCECPICLAVDNSAAQAMTGGFSFITYVGDEIPPFVTQRMEIVPPISEGKSIDTLIFEAKQELLPLQKNEEYYKLRQEIARLNKMFP